MAPDSCDWGMSINYFLRCTRGTLDQLVSAVFHCKIAVIFNILINYAFEHI